MSLETLAEQIRANLRDEARNANECKWQRAQLYAAARRQFRADRQFGEWLNNNVRSTAGGLPSDSDNVIKKLILCLEYLSEDEFMRLGYTKSAELMNKTMWNKYPDEMTALVHIGHEFTKEQIRQAIRDIKTGTANLQLPEPSFFSDKQGERLLQARLLKIDLAYCLEFLGMTPDMMNREELTKARRRLSMKYHPDRGGSEFEFQCVTDATDWVEAQIGLAEGFQSLNAAMRGEEV